MPDPRFFANNQGAQDWLGQMQLHGGNQFEDRTAWTRPGKQARNAKTGAAIDPLQHGMTGDEDELRKIIEAIYGPGIEGSTAFWSDVMGERGRRSQMERVSGGSASPTPSPVPPTPTPVMSDVQQGQEALKKNRKETLAEQLRRLGIE